MPEIKNTFTQGKMNKDLDERLLPNGQYRDALNVEVSTSEGSNVGTVQNVLGNHRLESIVDTTSFKCVGSIANEQTNKLYWFISRYDLDAILEYDITSDTAVPVLVDTNAGNYKAVLKFSGNIITGINIIDNLLFFTDNNSEPKKINIEECKKGTDADAFNTGNYQHTQLVFENGGFNGITIGLVSPWSGNDTIHAQYFNGTNTVRTGRYAYLETKQLKALLGDSYDFIPDLIDGTGEYTLKNVRHYRNGKFLGVKIVKIRHDESGTRIQTTEPGQFTNANLVFPDLPDSDFTGANVYLRDNHYLQTWHIGDVIFGDNISLDIEERHITVIKPKPLNALSVKINHEETTSTSNIPNLFETKFPRFSYRYKFRDGEYSAFAPFTTAVFNPKYPKDTGLSTDSNVFYNKDNAYDIKEPYNKAMVNSIHSVILSDFINAQTPEDVVEIDILYKQEESSVIYSIDTIKTLSPDWHSISTHEGLGLALGVGKSAQVSKSYKTDGGFTKGRYTVTTENIYAALPANQLLRPWDNVPRKALAQEITGNRIVYGNYVQNYDLVNDAQVAVNYSDRKNSIGSFASQGLPSIKSQRNYQVGVIYCDKFGRETPVFTSRNAAVNVPWQNSNGKKNASKSNQLNVNVANNFPGWVDSLKFFVKETSNPYYNLTMDRAWVTKSTYDLDDSEGHLWMSFPSSDRNKISEEDYIILKKKIGAGEEQVNFENKYKVIDIQNEAPDAIKYRLVNVGSVQNTNSNKFTSDAWNANFDKFFPFFGKRPDRPTDQIVINAVSWLAGGSNRRSLMKPQDAGFSSGDTNESDVLLDNLYISWFLTSGATIGNSHSKKYKVSGGFKNSTNGYVLKLASPITRIDADIAHITSNSFEDDTSSDMPTELILQIEQRELRESEDFSGKFFVKISKNQVTGIIQTGNIVDVIDQYEITSKGLFWEWKDRTGNFDVNASNYGIANHSGAGGSGSGDDFIQHIDNNQIGEFNAENYLSGGTDLSVNGGVSRITNYSEMWEGIKEVISDNDYGNGAFFIDRMHMAAGQSDASNYAKYCCVTWSGTDSLDPDLPKESAWSYPPLKTWITDYGDTLNMITPGADGESITTSLGGASITVATPNFPAQSVWYEDNLITTAPILSANDDYEGLKIDGWVGPLQKVQRDPTTSQPGNVHINGLEGFVNSTNARHTTGARRWFSGMTGSDHGVGTDTKTYSDNGEVGKHFMHLSFFAPGKDLHNGNWSTSGGTLDSTPTGEGAALYGSTSFAANLQGIWGGGVFTGRSKDEKFGTDTLDENKFFHMPMEGNNDDSGNILPGTPGPGVGYGYDLKYRELHERQWDPTFNTGDTNYLNADDVRDFIRNLHPGSKFRFSSARRGGNASNTVYTIKKVQVKKLYNHTSWRKPYNRYIASNTTEPYLMDQTFTNDHVAYKSVEELGLEYLNQLDATGVGTTSTAFRKKIEQFGAAHNRRVCYIIELDKQVDRTLYGGANADFVDGIYADIEFLSPAITTVDLRDLNKFPAIWELDPKKAQVDLDIYYEASSNIPVKLNEKTNELFAPLGCKVEVINSTVSGTSFVESWNGSVVTLHPGLPKGNALGNEINYASMSFKFIRQNGSYTIAEAGQQDLDGVGSGLKTTFTFRENVGDVIAAGLDWYNCFSFGNGIESNRIKDDFNEVFISNGVKASTTTQEAYKEERRKTGLIYSGIYNSNSGVNDLNQFIQAEPITKDLNPTYGSIQKLFQRRISLIAFCEDRVVGITSNKDTIFNADGNSQLIASNKVLGDANPFEGNYGISTNPESFASESYRAYFIDKQRGAVVRLSKDGLTPISSAGMKDWFRDNLPEYNTLLGTYDSYKENYNVTLTNNPNFNENLVLDAYLETGTGLDDTQEIGTGNIVENPLPSTDTPLNYLQDIHVVNDNDINNPFTWHDSNSPVFSDDTFNFKGSAQVINRNPINFGELQGYVEGVDEVLGDVFGGDQNEVSWTRAEYSTWDNNSTSSVYPSSVGLPDNGWWYDPRFTSLAGDVFGPSATDLSDAQVYSTIRRHMQHVDWPASTYTPYSTSSNSGYVDENNANAHPTIDAVDKWHYNQFSAEVDYTTHYPTSLNTTDFLGDTSRCITRDANTGAIVFDRVDEYAHPTYGQNFVEFKDIGSSIHGANNPPGAGVMETYRNAGADYPGFASWADLHRSMFNGDEIHIQFELKCYPTRLSYGQYAVKWGYNFIVPKLELYDGDTIIPSSKLVFTTLQGNDQYFAYARQQTTPSDLGSDFESAAMPFSPFYPGSIADYKVVYPFTEASSTITFPSTESIADLSTSSSPYLTTPKTIICGASFKFRDPNQQNADGSLIGGWGSGPSGYGIEEVRVVDDLRIRISNALPGSPQDTTAAWLSTNSLTTTDYSGNYWTKAGMMQSPLWEINNLKIKKGFSVVAPFIPFQAETFENVTGAEVLVAAVDPVAAVPPAQVPRWSQVVHDSNYGFGSGGWTFTKNAGSTTGAYIYQTAALTSGIGGTYDVDPVVQTGEDANGNTLSWVIPGTPPGDQGYADFTAPGDYTAGGGYFDADTTSALAGDFGTPNTVEYEAPDNSLVVGHPSGGHSYIKRDITADPYNTNDWYLIDIEYDETFGDGANIDAANGTIGASGYIALPHLGPETGSVVENDAVYPGVGVGVSKGTGSNNHHIGLIPVTRTEYGGPPKTVLRAIYYPHGSSKAVTLNYANYPDVLMIMVANIILGIKIDKIVVKKLNQGSGWTDWLNTNGVTVDNWDRQAGGFSNPYEPQHAFDKRRIYAYGGKLCWEVPDGEISNIIGENTYKWEQSFINPPTANLPADKAGWEFSFTVSENPKTNASFAGRLRGFVFIQDFGAAGYDASTGLGGFEGIYFTNIEHTGDYLIKFNFNGTTSSGSWTFERSDTGQNLYQPYSGSLFSGSDMAGSWSHGIVENKIHFSTGNTDQQEYAVSSIRLTDSTPIFSGGSANSWSFYGFNTSLYDYIFWDLERLNLEFSGCPVTDPSTAELKFININQRIDKTINKNEKYEISFTHGISSNSTAKLSIYYYNTKGFGFKIKDIDDTSDGNTGDINVDVDGSLIYANPGVQPFKQIVTIGDSEWSNINEDNNQYNADLKSSFVIQVQGDPNDPNAKISGYIDNIVMLRVIEGGNYEDTTVSFSEGVKGWTSFKSFKPDNGLSLSKKYFTFENGGLYQHYVPLKYDATVSSLTTGYTDNNNNFVKWTAHQAENYNRFYGVEASAEGAFSSITTVLNQEPSLVKMFNTINYEGSQTYVVKPMLASNVTINNAIAWSNGDDIKGWQCSEIKTDLDSGTVKEFIQKEGKWFNYIKGLNTDHTKTNTSLFSTQGIGIIASVDDVTEFDVDGEEIVLGTGGGGGGATIGTEFNYGGAGGSTGGGTTSGGTTGGGGGGGY